MATLSNDRGRSAAGPDNLQAPTAIIADPPLQSYKPDSVEYPSISDFWGYLKDQDKQQRDFTKQVIELLGNLTRERPHTRFDLSGSAPYVTHIRSRMDHLIVTNNHAAVQVLQLNIGGRSDMLFQIPPTVTQSFALPGIMIDRGITVQIIGSINQLFNAYLFSIVEMDVFEPPFRASFP